jgi:ribosomal-protein-alanine N-acetyltransferase
MIEVLAVGHAHARLLARLHGSCFDAAWSEESFEALLDTPGTFALLARISGKEAGFILARAVADEAEILSLGVVPPARGKGVGKHLIAAAADRCLGAGAKRLFLEVGDENKPAMGLYRRLGFLEVGRRRGYYRDGLEDALTLKADLPLCGLGNDAEVD